jgi:hypothetical protein
MGLLDSHADRPPGSFHGARHIYRRLLATLKQNEEQMQERRPIP